MITKLLANTAFPGGPKGSLSVLIFHRILSKPDPLNPDEPDERKFDRICHWLSRSFNVLPLDEAVNNLASGTLPARAVAITFDDGYHDNYAAAMPILLKHHLSATFFIATGFLDGGCMWNDMLTETIRGITKPEVDLQSIGLGEYKTGTWEEKRSTLRSLIPLLKYLPLDERARQVNSIGQLCGHRAPNDIMMTSEQVVTMRDQGMLIGAHTKNHPILSSLDNVTAQQEIVSSKIELEKLLDQPVTLFAYPNGKPGKDYHSEHVAMVKAAGFHAAVSTSIGVSTISSDTMQIPRFTPWDNSELRFNLRLLKNTRTQGKEV